MTPERLAAIEARLNDEGFCNITPVIRADLMSLLAEVRQLRSALEGLVDDERCQYDHHGYCQTHGIANPCEMAVAREALGLESLA